MASRVGKYRYMRKKPELKYTSMEYEIECYDSGDEVGDIDMGIC
jgi:hypothetical protein